MKSSFIAFSNVLRSCLPKPDNATAAIRSSPKSLIFCFNSSSSSGTATSILVLPHFCCNSNCALHCLMIISWPTLMASTKSASLHSFASPSTINMLSTVPAMITFNSAFSASFGVGFTTNCPSIFVTRTSEIGPSNGIEEMLSAADAANPTNESGSTFSSAEIR